MPSMPPLLHSCLPCCACGGVTDGGRRRPANPYAPSPGCFRSRGSAEPLPTGPAGAVLELHEFRQWRQANPGVTIGHIKGFGEGMGDFYADQALAEISQFDVIAFDGDAFKEDGFTSLIPPFLKLGPEKRVLAFKVNYSLKTLREKWDPLELWGQMTIISVDKKKIKEEFAHEASQVTLPDKALDFFFLGRAALVATNSRHVVCLGGGGIAAQEALVATGNGVLWTIFALSRGKKEAHPTLMDWAMENREKLSDCLKFVTGKDPNEADAFASMA